MHCQANQTYLASNRTLAATLCQSEAAHLSLPVQGPGFSYHAPRDKACATREDACGVPATAGDVRRAHGNVRTLKALAVSRDLAHMHRAAVKRASARAHRCSPRHSMDCAGAWSRGMERADDGECGLRLRPWRTQCCGYASAFDMCGNVDSCRHTLAVLGYNPYGVWGETHDPNRCGWTFSIGPFGKLELERKGL